MEIKIVGINVINGEQCFHKMIDSSIEIPTQDTGNVESLPPKTVYSYEELQQFQDEQQEKFNAIHPEGCFVFLSYCTDAKASEAIKRIQYNITDKIEAL